MRFKFVLILGAIAVLAAIAAGCGGSSDSTSGTTAATTDPGSTTAASTNGKKSESKTEKAKAGESSKPLTSTEFQVRVNELCIQVPPTYEDELEKLEKGGKKLTLAEKNLKAAVPPLYSTIEAMEEITPPKGEEEALEKMISSLDAAAKGLEAAPTSELSGPGSPFAEFQATAKKFNFGTCEGL